MARPAALLLLVMVLLSLVAAALTTPRANAAKGMTALAVLLPAPVGYSYTFGQGYDIEIYGYQDSQNNYYSYRSYLGTGDFVLVKGLPTATALISSSATIWMKFVVPESLQAFYVVSTGSAKYVIVSEGTLIGSNYPILNSTQPTNISSSQQFVEIFANAVKLPPLSNEIVVMAVTKSSMYLNIYLVRKNKTTEITESLASLLNLPSSCFTWFSSPIQQGNVRWLGGLAYSPACLSNNVTPEVEVTYQGITYYVAFSATTKYGHINYVIFASPTIYTLAFLGLIHFLDVKQLYHVLPYTWPYSYLYVITPDSMVLTPPNYLAARDISQVAPDGNATCVMPQGSQVIYELLWRYRQLGGLVELMPGEVLLFEYNNQTFFCHGALNWLFSSSVLVRGPAYQELAYPIQVIASGAPVLIVESDGKVLYGTRVSIPWGDYKDNMIYAVTGAGVTPIAINAQPIFASPVFLVGVIIAGVLVGSIVFSRPAKPQNYVTLVDDLPEVQPMELASEEKVKELAAKHVDRFGTCPDDIDLAAYHGILPPIPPEGGERVYCPWRINPETERAFKEIAGLLAEGLFAIVRKRDYAYAYTIVGDSRLILYFYKQEFEENPVEVVRNALLSLYRAVTVGRPQGMYFDRPLGLAIFTTPDMRRRVEAELERLRSMFSSRQGGPGQGIGSELDKEKRGGALQRYFTSAGAPLPENVDVDKLVELADYLRDALVVSTDDMTKLIEFLSERVASVTELTAKMRGDQSLDSLGALA